jgi:hypothetical protein
MANALYGKGREGFLDGSIDWDTDTIKLVCVDSADYILSIDVHSVLSDIAAIGRVATSGALTSKTVTLGVADAADVTLSAVTGDSFEYIILYKDTGVATTSRLIACIDTATGLPCTPNGGDVIIQFDDGPNKIFKL